MNDCILLQSSQDWHLQRMYMKKFNKLVLVKVFIIIQQRQEPNYNMNFPCFRMSKILGY